MLSCAFLWLSEDGILGVSSAALDGMSRTLSSQDKDLPGQGRACLGRAELFTSREPKQFGARSPFPLPLSPIPSSAVGKLGPSLALPLKQEGLTEVIPRPGDPVLLPPWDLTHSYEPPVHFTWLLISRPEFLRMQSSELHHAFCFVFPVFQSAFFPHLLQVSLGLSYYCLLFSGVSM